jgi:hypothetical protein
MIVDIKLLTWGRVRNALIAPNTDRKQSTGSGDFASFYLEVKSYEYKVM